MESLMRKHYTSFILAFVLFIGGLFVGYIFVGNSFAESEDGVETETNALKEDEVQAVFLSNDQVYFGDITALTDESVVMKNIYYLQVSQDLQANEPSSSEPTEAQQNFQLVKLGNEELHGPEDSMMINRDHVLFWENLKPDSAVVKAINNYKTEKK